MNNYFFLIIMFILIILILYYVKNKGKPNNKRNKIIQYSIIFLISITIFLSLFPTWKITINLLLSLLLLIIIIIFNYLISKKNINKKIIYTILIITVFGTIYMILSKNIVNNFNTLEELFHYKYPNENIKEIFETENGAFIISSNNSTYYFFKNLEKWKYTYNDNIKSLKNIAKHTVDGIIITIIYSKDDFKLVIVNTFALTEKETNITDSINSNFYKSGSRYYTVIEPNVEKYHIIINDEKIDFKLK